MTLRILLLLFTSLALLLQSIDVFCQYETKSLEARHLTVVPHIDGILDDNCWKDAPIATGFIKDKPNPGTPLAQNTEVRVVYNHEAMYIGITCYDTAPDSIFSQLSGRDVSGNTDFCGITFSCYRDGVNGFTFISSAKGEQYDARMDGNGEDVSWNAVWYCKTRISEIGWVAEFMIPFAAIRFPDLPEQIWNINFVREVRRSRNHAYWNGVNPLVPGYLTQMGTLTGISDIKPPRRIFLYPYTSTYYDSSRDEKGKSTGSFSYNAGMDMKLGLSDAFTLDATLIPDFGQTLSDQQILNLSAFELQFADNRQFFTEGTELFNRAGIFYSRRIGFDRPVRYSNAGGSLFLHEKLIENPLSDNVVNAIKISGRDKNKLGVGFFNAVTSPSEAIARDTITGAERRINTSTLTNYNVFVLDQILPHNSYVSLINTSVYRAGDDFDVNVTGTEFDIRDKKNKFSITGSGALNSKYGKEFSGPYVKGDNGFRHALNLNKISGNWKWAIGQYVESDTYDPTDLGFLAANNEISYAINQSYNIYKPFGRFNNMTSSVSLRYTRLYNPNTFTLFETSGDGNITTRKFNTYGYNFTLAPVRGYDYFEPRVAGRYFRTYTYNRIGTWYSSDYRKRIAFDASVFYSDYENPGRYVFNWRVAPRFRLNDHLFITYVYSYQAHMNDIGFAYNFEDANRTMPLFAVRNVVSHTNVLNLKYAFNPIMTLNLRVRHYWGYTKFKEFHGLLDDGYLRSSDSTSPDQSFNSFTIDLIYSWIFMPGSALNFVWKNSITNFNDRIPDDLVRDLDFTLSLPQDNSYSLKLIYFLDYHSVASRLSKDLKKIN